MSMFLRLLKTETRRMAVRIPGMAARMTVMVLLLGAAAVCVMQAGRSPERVHPFTVGYSVEEGDRLGSFAVFYVENMESMSGICRFVPVSEEEGEKQLKQGGLAAYIHFPKQFIEKIMDGTNEPVVIRMPETMTVEAALLRDAAKAGAEMLSVSQAEIYASYSLAMKYGQAELIPQMQEDINVWNLKLALNRNEMFRTREVSATGQATAAEYGAASLLVLCLFLFGIPCSSFLISAPDELAGMLRRAGVAVWQQVFVKLLVMAAALFGFSLILISGVSLGGQYGFRLTVSWEPETWAGVWMACLCVASILVWCGHIVPGESSMMLLIFWIAVILIFLSGGFLPSVFLPVSLQSIADYLPGKWLLEEMSGLFSWESSVKNHMVLLGFTALFFFLTAVGETIRGRSGRSGRSGENGKRGQSGRIAAR